MLDVTFPIWSLKLQHLSSWVSPTDPGLFLLSCIFSSGLLLTRGPGHTRGPGVTHMHFYCYLTGGTAYLLDRGKEWCYSDSGANMCNNWYNRDCVFQVTTIYNRDSAFQVMTIYLIVMHLHNNCHDLHIYLKGNQANTKLRPFFLTVQIQACKLC